jgi:hypothetical protein
VHSADYRSAKVLMDRRVEKARRQAEPHHLLQQAGVESQIWLSRQGRELTRSLALLLVSLGARLVSYGLPPYQSVAGRTDGGRRSMVAV